MSGTDFEFVPQKGRAFDVFAAIHRYAREKAGLDAVAFKDGTDGRVIAAFDRVSMTIGENIGQTGFLFESGEGFPAFFADIFNKYARDASSAVGLAEHIRSLPHAEFSARILSFFDGGNNYSLSFYKGALENRAMLTEILNNTDLSPDVKWDVVNFIQSPENGIAEIASLIEAVDAEVGEEYIRSAELLSELYATVEEGLKRTDMDLLHRRNFRYEDYISSGGVTEVVWIAALFEPVDVAFIRDRRSLYVYLGLGFEASFRRKYDSRTNRAVLFKAFAENVRFRILDELSGGEKYASQLSRSLSLPMTSLIHHMAILEQADVVTRRTEGKKVYYRINEPMLEVAIDLLSGFCNGR